MKLSSVTLSNFRCFGPTAQTIPLDSGIAALIGSNGAGKSSTLAALSKIFGLTNADRSLVRSDFHLPAGKTWETVGPIEMRIELCFELPELIAGKESAGAPAAVFKHLAVTEPGKPPVCRARLQATWTPSSVAEGDIDSNLSWVLAPGKDGDSLRPLGASDRAAIVVHYIPATRDPIRHIRQSTGSILHGFLRAISWSKETKAAVEKASQSIRDAVGGELGMKTVNGLVEACWQELHKEGTHSKVLIQPVARTVDELIHQVDTVFQPSACDREEGVERLSDGQRSLFYIALVAMSFDVQARLRKDKKHGLLEDKVKNPVLTILAVEEPENHVSPHYLGRIVTLLKRIGKDVAGQVVLTSHSASIMARVEPEDVRHLSFDPATKLSTVKRITLPPKNTDREKFLREAVRAYPELYFSKLVILGEGDSEALVIPRLARALGGLELDTSLISFVPLGGRHVNHFWKLLNGLGIPHLTILDLDLGRDGGGWGRIKYALEQLLELGVASKELVGDVDVSNLHKQDGSTFSKDLASWLPHLEKYNVYFSAPLDLDFAMLQAFPAAYQKLEPGLHGPQAADDETLIASVLGEKSKAAAYYMTLGAENLRWYRYLFLGRGKPATHAAALNRLSDEDLKKSTPENLRRLVGKVSEIINPEVFDLF